MSFEEKLRKVKKDVKKSSQDTYLRNIRRLYKIENELPISNNSKWLERKSLQKWFLKQTLSIRRHLATAALVALKIYKKENDFWYSKQQVAREEYDKQRQTRTLSEKQKKNIPGKGFDSLYKVVKNLKAELRHVLKNIDTLSDLLRVQDLIILSLYAEIPMRLDYATLQLGRGTVNSIYKNTKKPRGWTISLTDFKTAKSQGPKIFRLKQANQRLLNIFVPAVKKLTDHGFLLSNRLGKKMSKQVLSKRLMKLTKEKIGKRFSTQLLRVLYAMKNRDLLMSAKEVSDTLMHSQKQSIQYAKKD